MSNLSTRTDADLDDVRTTAEGVQVLRPREVPLGGPRAMTVRRTLPHRERSFVGAWCFVDHYGPDDVTGAAGTPGMDVPPHPHTGLQTVSWLFAGEVEHRDSTGVHALVRPGEVNLMTAGHGIAHSEVSTPATTTLHGVQLWVLLPGSDRDAVAGFEHHAPALTPLADGVSGRVFLGRLGGVASPVHTHTPLLGAELHLEAGVRVELPVDPAFEHAVLVDAGTLSLDGTDLARGDLGIVDAGRASLTLRAEAADGPVRALLLGGTPYDEEVVMWWNFVGRDHDEVMRFREEWEQHSARFGEVEGYDGTTARLAAPPLPNVRLRARGRTGRSRRS